MATREGKLKLGKCVVCGHLRFYHEATNVKGVVCRRHAYELTKRIPNAKISHTTVLVPGGFYEMDFSESQRDIDYYQ